MPEFAHKRHHRTRIVSESYADAFRTSPNWREIADVAPPARILHDADPDTKPSRLVVPEGTVAEVLEWAGDDPLRRRAALETERSGRGRVTLIKALQ